MIPGEISTQLDGAYRISLNNGQNFSLEEKYIPESLRVAGTKVNLVFGGVEEAKVNPEDARVLVNSLLGLS